MAKKLLLGCGVLSSLLYFTITNIVGPMLYPGYSLVSQVPSELFALGAPSQPYVSPPATAYSVLLLAFGIGVWLAAGGKRALRIAGVLLCLAAVLPLAMGPFTQIEPRGVAPTETSGLSGTLHIIVYGALTPLLMFLYIGFGSAAFGNRFRLYSIATIVVILVAGILVGRDAPRVEANLPTPRIGLTERILIFAYLLWIAVLAIKLIRTHYAPVKPAVEAPGPHAARRSVPCQPLHV